MVGQNSMNLACNFSCKLMTPPFPFASTVIYQNQNTRIKEGIININPDEEPLRSELLSGKFTVLVSVEAIAFYKVTAAYRFTTTPQDTEKTVHMLAIKEEICVFVYVHVSLHICICVSL